VLINIIKKISIGKTIKAIDELIVTERKKVINQKKTLLNL